ncbi:MAG: hypothetical protein DRI93_02675 [Aquificota bacterium]|nr:MAG: hypothetical protein DRI93_02675 [Aquificota bacterium]
MREGPMPLADKRCEIIVPCGDSQVLSCILSMDVDAFYFGIRGWSRADRNQEFSLFQVEELCERAQEKGKRALLSFNLMPSPMEAEQAWRVVREAILRGVKEVICSDPFLAIRIKENYPQVDIHASLGAVVLSSEEAHFWADLGASRVVLSPHLSSQEIEEITLSLASRSVETEVMIFGVRCHATMLGLCRMSSYFDMNLENSGLRTVIWSGSSKRSGVCYRTCSQEWLDHKGREWEWAPEFYWDLWKLPALLQAGVRALKIGGRGMGWKKMRALVKAIREKIREEESYV